MPLPVPTEEVFDDPSIEIHLNDKWASFIDGTVGFLLDRELWQGDETEIDFAIQQVRIFLRLLGAIAPTVFTIFGDGDADFASAFDDTTPLNLGVRFQSNISGFITGIRIWRRDVDNNDRIGYLWENDGTLLGSADFPDDELGWSTASFDTPIAIDADTTYVASAYFGDGHFVSSNGFLATEYINGNLTALADGADGANGVYVYDVAGTFPVNTFGSTNYWIDVVFS